jgi:hypothetical protein
VTVFGEVYDNARSDAAHTVTITTSLRNAAGVALRTTVDERSSLELGDGARAYRFIAGMPLDDLTPGAYLIHVEARSEFADPAVSRDIQIVVR